MIQYSGYPGASVDALIQLGLSDVYDFEPDLVILDIGTNDLSSSPPEKVANAIVFLVNYCYALHTLRKCLFTGPTQI